MSTYNPTVSTLPLQESYGYDQLNRITAHASNAGHASSYSYDPNGNILKLSRTSTSGSIDQLDYRYEKIGTNSYVRNRNRLRKVADGSGNDAGLPTGQLEDSYVYDELGELSSDQKANVTSIEWNVYGKVKKVNKTAASADLEFLYDATGNRIAKIVKPMASKADNTTWQYTWYVRNAQGNVMATYQQNAGSTQLAEHHIYGSSRLGVARYTATPVISATATNQDNTGDKAYELTDHLGNVRVVLSDRQENVSGTVKSEIFSATDYWPFGMSMGDRSFTTGITGLGGYRYGFNGMEKESQIAEGDYDFGARIYDSRLGRWLAVDALARQYTDLTPYCFAANMPIRVIDGDGRKILFVNGHYQDNIFGKYIFGSDKPGKAYWGSGFAAGAQKFFKDYSPVKESNYINGSSMVGVDQSGQERMDAGYEYAKGNLETLTADMVEGETFKIVTHSEGAAYGAGVAKYLLEKGYKVETIVHLSPDEPDEFKTPVEPTTYQLGYKGDWVTGNGEVGGVDRSGIVDKFEKASDQAQYSHGSTRGAEVFSELEDLKTSDTQLNLDGEGKSYYSQSGSAPNGTKFSEIKGTPIKK